MPTDLNLFNLTFEQIRLIIIVYTSAIIPLVIFFYSYYKQNTLSWIFSMYLLLFLVCAVGWESWFTYGWLGGENVNLRRDPLLSFMIPIHINWILNSLADVGTICLGGSFLGWILMKKNNKVFNSWDWRFFFLLLSIFLFQNVFVEMFLYHDQLSIGKTLSWAPLSPLGPWFNPIIFTFNERSISLQSQIPWIIMTPIFYKLLIYYYNR